MMIEESNIVEPKVLIISNNALSDTNNNGKTLASFFKEFKPDRVAQLYFNNELPKGTKIGNFFQVTDKDVIKAIIKSRYQCGRVIKLSSCNQNLNKVNSESRVWKIKKTNTARILRELLWKTRKWKTTQLDTWLDEVSPDIIFFCAGDSTFAYDITGYIRRKFNSKLVIYITDDYILPRRTLNPLWWIRRFQVLRKMRSYVRISDLFITISEKMRSVYKDYLGKDSFVAVNMSEPMKSESNNYEDKNVIELIYTGGLHLNRYKTLELLVNSTKKFNENSAGKFRLHLTIYSNVKPEKKILSKLNINDVSSHGGSLNYVELKDKLNSSNILVYVESFDRRSIESTKLSISTKIPEYLSLGKPILAIGPKEVASMDYLKEVAFCINNPKTIYEKLTELVTDEFLQSNLSKYAFEKYNQNHRIEILSKHFKNSILKLYNDK